MESVRDIIRVGGESNGKGTEDQMVYERFSKLTLMYSPNPYGRDPLRGFWWPGGGVTTIPGLLECEAKGLGCSRPRKKSECRKSVG